MTATKTCRHCRAQVALTRYGYLSHHLAGRYTCWGSQSDDWEREAGEKQAEPEAAAEQTQLEIEP